MFRRKPSNNAEAAPSPSSLSASPNGPPSSLSASSSGQSLAVPPTWELGGSFGGGRPKSMDLDDSSLRTLKGHDLVVFHASAPIYCDHCTEYIWGLFKTCYRCTKCRYTCHKRCAATITLECLPVVKPTKTSFKRMMAQGEKFDMSRLSKKELKKIAETYTKNTGQQLEVMKDGDEAIARGIVRISMDLSRPVNVASQTRRPSIVSGKLDGPDLASLGSSGASGAALGAGATAYVRAVTPAGTIGRAPTGTIGRTPPRLLDIKNKSSFYIAPATLHSIALNSNLTSLETIAVLLAKFSIKDNPRKFALYVVTNDSKATVRRVSDSERPLEVVIGWGCSKHTGEHLSLQEEDEEDAAHDGGGGGGAETADEWSRYTEDELETFLSLLTTEEEEAVERLQNKYASTKTYVCSLISDATSS